MVLLLIVYRVRHRDGDGKAFNGLDDEDDERANIMVYHTEGGGEEDQVNKKTFGYKLQMIQNQCKYFFV